MAPADAGDWTPLGPFQLDRVIGRGGMGEVWSGRHVAQGIPVAVKVATGPMARSEAFREAFQAEVQAVARLDHPGIVMVFDVGEVPERTARLSTGRLQEGQPYLVMELASGGSLEGVEGPLPWSRLGPLLRDLLDALAHAHARGVVHRDIKHANVLVSGEADLRPGLKLTDFGVAHALDAQTRTHGSALTHSSQENPSGTPAFMAPEQFEGRWRDYGPWTDLYALGCMAYELASGRLPFQADNFLQYAVAHMRDVPPALPDEADVPPGFARWLAGCLAKAPEQRYQCAADAAHDLEALGGSGSGGGSGGGGMAGAAGAAGRGPSRRPRQAVALAETIPNEPVGDGASSAPLVGEHDLVGPEAASGGGAAGPSPAPPPLRCPPSWRREQRPAPQMALVGAGLGLYDLRAVPMVDRDAERDLLWGKLREVEREGRAAGVILGGAAGTGKSRLAEWLCQRAQEVGAATVLRAQHSPVGSPADGLGRMVLRHMRAVGLDREDLLERTRGRLWVQGVADNYEWNALTELMQPARGEEGHSSDRFVRFGGPEERYRVLQRLIRRIGRERTAIVWLDDVHWGDDALGFALQLLSGGDSDEGTRALVVLTVRDDLEAERHFEARRLGALAALPNVTRLAIGPLEASDSAALVHGLLGLERRLANRVAQRCGGNPLFAVQLVGDWVRRRVLEVREGGFTLAAGERALLPDDIHQVWTARIERLLDEETGPAQAAVPSREALRQSLELAAALGEEVEVAEWREACRLAGLPSPQSLLSGLIGSYLAEPKESSFAFVHNMLRESLRRGAIDGRRWLQHNRTCAEMLAATPARDEGLVLERRGRHLLEAQSYEESLAPSLRGALLRRERGDYRAATTILLVREHAMRMAALPADDVRWGEGWVARAHVLALEWRFEEARELAERAREQGEAARWQRVLPEAYWLLGWCARRDGQGELAERHYQHALALYRAIGDGHGSTNCLRSLGIAARQRGDLASSRGYFEQAMAYRDQLGADHWLVGQVCYGMAATRQRSGEPELAVQWLAEAMRIGKLVGNQQEVANALNMLAEIQRARGELEEAEANYRAAVSTYEAIGSKASLVPQLNLGLVLLARGNYGGARAVLEAGEERVAREKAAWLEPYVAAALLVCASRPFDGARWDDLLRRIESRLADSPQADTDLAWPLESAGELALAAGAREAGRRALELAHAQWTALGDGAGAARVEATLGRG